MPAPQAEHDPPGITTATTTNQVEPEPTPPIEPNPPVALPAGNLPNPAAPFPTNPRLAQSNSIRKAAKPPHLREKWVVNPVLKKTHSVDLDSLQPAQIQLGGGRGHH